MVQPRIQSRAVKLDPFIVVIAAIFGGTLFGVIGALLAIPIAAAIQIAVREFLEYRRETARFCPRAADAGSPARLYALAGVNSLRGGPQALARPAHGGRRARRCWPGLGAIVVPAVASVGTSVFIGIVLLLRQHPAGGARLSPPATSAAAAAPARGGADRDRRALPARAPLEGTYTLTVMLVIWFVAIGFARIAGGLAHLGAPGAGATAFSGLISVVLGILIAEELPSSADWAIGLLVGIDFLFFGVSCLLLWLRDRKGSGAGSPGARAEQPAV